MLQDGALARAAVKGAWRRAQAGDEPWQRSGELASGEPEIEGCFDGTVMMLLGESAMSVARPSWVLQVALPACGTVRSAANGGRRLLLGGQRCFEESSGRATVLRGTSAWAASQRRQLTIVSRAERRRRLVPRQAEWGAGGASMAAGRAGVW